MGSNTLISRNAGDTINETDVNQYRTAFDGDILPRSSGAPTNVGGSLGSSSNKFLNTYVSSLCTAGTVGIGTDSPSSLLHTNGTTGANIFHSGNTINDQIGVNFGTTPGDRTKAFIGMENTNTGNSAGDIVFKTNSGASLDERVRIDSLGNVSVGPVSGGSYLFNVQDSQNTNIGVLVKNETDSTSSRAAIDLFDDISGASIFMSGASNTEFSGLVAGSLTLLTQGAAGDINLAARGTSKNVNLYAGGEINSSNLKLSANSNGVSVFGELSIEDGISTPATELGKAKLYVDSADGDLKIKFSDGTIKTIVTDT